MASDRAPIEDSRIVRGACHHDCPDTCAWQATVEREEVVRLRGDPDHPTTRGQLCPKVNRFVDRVYHRDRLLTPLRRVGRKGSGQFQPISWDEAIQVVADELGLVLADHGPAAILQYSFDGTQGVVQKGVMADRFFDELGASDIHRHLCGVTAWQGAADVSGLPYGIDPEDLRHAKTLILWGTNTLLTNRHLWPTIQAAKAGGATLIVIDPIKTTTAAAPEVDIFLQIRPGTDVALVLGMVHVMDRDGLIDSAWLADHTSGWEDLQASAATMPPARAESLTGIPAAQIEALAHTYVANRPAAIRVLVGPEHRQHGRDLMRSIALLPAVTGAWRDIGGGLARSTQIYFEEALNYPVRSVNRRMFNMAALGATLCNDALDPPVRALVVHNSNPAVICPDQNAVVRGLESDDLFTVVLEQFMTDTARFADVVLPTTTQLEHLDLMVSWGHMYLALNQPAIAPRGEALSNSEIFRRLAAEMGMTNPVLSDSDEGIVRQFLDSSHPWLRGISYERLEAEGWVRLNVPPGYQPYADHPPATDDGRFRLRVLTYRPGAETAEGDPDRAVSYPLVLMSRKQHPRFLNANYGGFAEHFPRTGEPVLEIHPADAASRRIVDGARVVVTNERGSVTLTASLSDAVQPGLVTMPFGWWHGSGPTQRGVNALTNPSVASDGTGSAHFHENLVEVALEGVGQMP